METYRLLISLAHPDDEAFGCGGLIALNRRRSIHTTLLCATKGEAGQISSPDLATPANLGAVREQELRTAAAIMGVDDLYFLGYRDSGMAGTPENQHPHAFTNAPAGAVVPRLVRFIRTVRPQVIITFDPTGGYGHPDHIAIHQHTVAAFHAAADPAYNPAQGAPWQAARLLYLAFDRSIFAAVAEDLRDQGLEMPDFGGGEDDASPWPEQPVHYKLDVAATLDQKWAALHSHATQFGPDHPFRRVREPVMRRVFSQEWFEQVWPTPAPVEALNDLFHGL